MRISFLLTCLDVKNITRSFGEIGIHLADCEAKILKTKGRKAAEAAWIKLQKHVLHSEIGGKKAKSRRRGSISTKLEFIHVDSLILGGGWHALGCAAALKESGVTNFAILEKEEGVAGFYGDY